MKWIVSIIKRSFADCFAPVASLRKIFGIFLARVFTILLAVVCIIGFFSIIFILMHHAPETIHGH